MDIAFYFKHPENLNKETLYDLRSLLALYPYYQPARILLLQNLFLLHDPTFDEELRRAAIFVTDRRTLFRLVEEPHYQLRDVSKANQVDGETTYTSDSQQRAPGEQEAVKRQDRTVSLIENFLENIPKEEQPSEEAQRMPTPADATVDYVAYLLETENSKKKAETPELRGQSLIDEFINKEGGRIVLQDATEYEPEMDEEEEMEVEDTGYFTETLARIYIKQGRYSKALEIIKRLNLVYPKKNRYFADQIRFLEKLIINNNKK